MLILLPPSEGKRDGGADGCRYDPAALAFPELAGARRRTLAALRRLARNRTEMASVLKLGANHRVEVDRNRAIGVAPLLPAVERYNGVLFDALDAASLSTPARALATGHVVIHSALFGLVRADDPIPAYRLSHDSRLPGLALAATWRGPVSSALAAAERFVLDLRSESYVGLGAAPPGSAYVRVVSEDANGVRKALNHFNKKGKGEFVRALLEAGVNHGSRGSLIEWAVGAGIRLLPGDGDELLLVV